LKFFKVVDSSDLFMAPSLI